jgi:hypothetical protein
MRSFTSFAAVCLVLVLCVGCATNTKRSDFDNECEYAKAKYQETQESARLYYALGTTSVAEIAVAERRVKKAKNAVESACGVQLPDEAEGAADSVQ